MAFATRPWLPAILWFLFVLILLAIPGSEFPTPENWMKKLHADKWIHAFLFGMMAWLFYRPFKNRSKSTIVLVTLLVIVWGFTTEFLQGTLIRSRSFEWADVLADAAGAVIAWLIFTKMQAK